MLCRTQIPRRVARLQASFDKAARLTTSPTRGHHLVSRGRKFFIVPNKVAQAPYLPTPPKGFIYVRDASKSGDVPKLVRR